MLDASKSIFKYLQFKETLIYHHYHKMEQFIELYTTSKKELVYIYLFENGGLADFIKFARTVMNFCWDNKIRFYIYIHHPIAKYIVFKQPEINFLATRSREDAMRQLESSYRQIHKLNTTTDITSSDKMFLIPSACHDEVFPSIMPLGISFLSMMDFSSEIYQRISVPPSSYVAVHLRCGDLHMECATGYAGPTTDSRKWDENRLHKLLEELHQQGKKILFFSDTRKYKKQLATKYPFLEMTDTKIGHIGLQYVKDEDIANTLVEFATIIRAETIYAASYSGFTEIASQIGGRPIVRLWTP